MAKLFSVTVGLLALLSTLSCVAGEPTSCYAETESGNMSVQYLARYGTVSINVCDSRNTTSDYPEAGDQIQENHVMTFQMSLCTSDVLTSSTCHQQCGSGFFLDESSACAQKEVFSRFGTIESSKTSTDNSSDAHDVVITTLWTPNYEHKMEVAIECDHSAGILQSVDGNRTDSGYILNFKSMTVCPGYAPTNEDRMISKGAAVGAVVGIVIVVIVTAAAFQWRARRRCEGDYGQLL